MPGVKPIPDGFHSVTPHLVVKDGRAAIEFYKKAFGAIELMHMPGPGGQGTMHGEIKIGDSIVFIGDMTGNGSDSPDKLGATTCMMNIYVPDADATMKQAEAAGATIAMPAMDMFWGDRYGMVADPFGHFWGILTHVADPTPEEMERGQKEFMAQMASGECG